MSNVVAYLDSHKQAQRFIRALQAGEILTAPPVPLVAVDALKIPLIGHSVPAGFPSPSQDFIEKSLDLNEHLIANKSSTFIMRVAGESMLPNIHPGDEIIVDRAVTPKNNDVVVAILNAELTVKRLYKRDTKIRLLADNPTYPPIEMKEEIEMFVWGVVTRVLHKP